MELSEALADWRTEAMSRLAPTGIELDWPLMMDDLTQVLGARTMVQTTRIMREVFNNLIRHSQADKCTVKTVVQPDRLTLEIKDNGVGFETERLSGQQAGLGLLNMQHRARQIQGDCLIESTPGQGSRVCLSFPLQMQAA
jgi:signal transduction histidine kinase